MVGAPAETTLDPYEKWLGIPAREQPPNHYRLLGLKPFETDRNVIISATDQRMNHVKTFALGPHAELSQRLLNELAAAKLTLLDSRRRGAYDAVLQSAMPAAHLEESAPAPATPAARPIPVGATPAGTFAPGRSLAKYRILESVGSSAFGVTHKAQHADSGRYYFIKFLPDAARGNAEVAKRFERECEILTRLDHPNLIVGRETFVQDDVRFLVMDYVLGVDLATLVKQQGPLPVDQAVDYLIQAARGLMQLHLHDISHRNLKPQVLMVDLQGNLRITNLLLAKIGEKSTFDAEELTGMGEALGSYDYMPPEQALDARTADARSDVYALGCTFCHLLLGRPPYPLKKPIEKLMAHRTAPVPSLCALRDDVPPHVDRVFQRMLAKEPKDRYQFLGEMIDDLTPIPPALPWWKRWFSKVEQR